MYGSVYKENQNQLRSLVIYTISFFVIWFLYVLFGSQYLWVKINNPLLHKTLNSILKLIIFPLPVILYLKYYDYVNFITFLKLNTNPKKGLPYVLVLVVFGTFVYLTAQHFLLKNIGFNPFFDIFLWVNGVLLAGFSEELVFRGFILQKANELMSFWKANFINASLFLLIHFPQWIHADRITSLVVLLQMANIFCLGLALGYVFKKSNSLMPCILIHSILNFIAFSLGFKP